jgi:hypothetical protein
MVNFNKLKKWQILALIIYFETPDEKKKDLNEKLLKIVKDILNDK